MRRVREVLRLHHVCGHSGHPVAALAGVSRRTVAECLRRAGVVGITWQVPDGLDDTALERRLFSPPFAAEPSRPQPDWPRLHAELRRPGVTLQRVWEEHRAGQPEGYGHSRFCDLHAAWRGKVSPTMRQTHPAGGRMVVDCAGRTVGAMDAATGEVRRAQVLVAALGASSLTHAEARRTQGLPDWIGCHVGASAFFGGVARRIACDDLESGVPAACRHEPGTSRTCADRATRCGTAVLPARVRRPRDKAQAEAAVQGVRRWVPARLRNRRSFCLAALDAAIRTLAADLNDRTMRHLGTSRRALFEAAERSALLPPEPYAHAERKRCRAGLDCHVEVHGRFCSVPCRQVREVREARIAGQTISCGSRAPADPSGWKRPAGVAWTSAPAPTARCCPSCAMASTGPAAPTPCPTSCPSGTATSAAAAATIEEDTPMLTRPATDRLRERGLAGMARALEERRRQPGSTGLGFEGRLAMLAGREALERGTKRLAARLRFAGLRQQATPEDIDHRAGRGRDRALFQRLAGGGWIERHQALLAAGPTGTGRPWLSCALGHRACRDNRSVPYRRVPRLLEALGLARGDGRHARMLKSLARAQLLVPAQTFGFAWTTGP